MLETRVDVLAENIEYSRKERRVVRVPRTWYVSLRRRMILHTLLLFDWSPVFAEISISPRHCVTCYIGFQCLSAFCSKSPWWHLTVFMDKDQDTLMTSLYQFTLSELVLYYDLQMTMSSADRSRARAPTVWTGTRTSSWSWSSRVRVQFV